MKRAARYEWFKDASGEYRWRLRAANGEIVASGEGYKRKSGALKGIESHRRAASCAEVCEAKE